MKKLNPDSRGRSERAVVLAAILALIVVGALYAPVLRHSYVWDDLALFVHTPVLRDIHDLAAFWSGVSKPILPDTTYFRPAVLSTFVLEFWGNKVNPALSHFINLLLFLLNTLLVGVVASAQYEDGRPRWSIGVVMGMMFYGLHPANTEVVSWVSGRFDLLASTWGLLLLAADQKLQGRIRPVCMGLAYFMACASKEMALVFPLAYLALHAIRRSCFAVSVVREQRVASGVISIVVAGLVYIALRLIAMPALLHVDQHTAANSDVVERIVYVFRALWFYLETLIWPFFQVSPQHPLAIEDLVAVDYFKALGALAVLAFFLFLSLRGGRARAIWVLLLLYVVSLVPVLHVIPLTIGGNIGHERFMAWPLVFAALAVCRAFDDFLLFSKPGGYFFSLAFLMWLMAAAATGAKTIPHWKDEIALWTWAHDKHPRSGYVQASLASALFKQGAYDQVETLGERLLRSDPNRVPLDVLITMAQVDVVRGRTSQALDKMLRVDSYLDSPVWREKFLATGGSQKRLIAIRRNLDGLLSGAYLASGNVHKALFHARRGVEGLPRSPNAYLNLARAQYAADDWQAAEFHFREALKEVSEVDRRGPLAARAAFLEERCTRGDIAMPNVCMRWRQATLDR